MIKRIILSIILVNSIFLYSQENTVNYSDLVCKYHVKLLKDSTNRYNEKEEIMTLLIGDKISLFKSDQKAKSDSLKSNIIKNGLSDVNRPNVSKNNLNIDFSKVPRVNMTQEVLMKNGNLRIYDKVFKYLFSFEPKNKVEWNLVNEDKIIAGYKCKKAIGKYGKRNLIAWYTTDIPISEGPYTFKGLPGLIVSVKDEKDTYSFDLVYLKKEKREIIPIKNDTPTTYDKFFKARENAKNNAVSDVASILHREMTKEEKELVTSNANKVNNYLD